MKPFPRQVMQFILLYAKIFQKQIAVILLLVVFGLLLENLDAWFFAQIIDTLKDGVSAEALHKSYIYVLLIMFCSIGSVLFMRAYAVYENLHFRLPLQRKIHTDLFSYLQGHSYNYIVSRQTGLLLEKKDNIGALNQLLMITVERLFMPCIQVLIKSILLFIANPLLSFAFVSCVGLSMVVTQQDNKNLRKASKINGRLASLSKGWVVDVVSNIKLVKQFNNLQYEQKRLQPLLKQLYNMRKISTRLFFVTHSKIGVIINVASVAVLSLAVWLWTVKQLTLGNLVYTLILLNSGLMMLNEMHIVVKEIKSKIGYIASGLSPFADEHDIKDAENAKNLKVKDGKIEFKNVSFAYNEHEKVLNKFNLSINAKEKVGIVGISGSGKTTLINLLQRAYEVDEGQILIDGQDIKKVTQDSLHQNLAFIPQEPVLFHRSLKENITYAKPSSSHKKMLEAAKFAYVDDFVKNLQDGYDTIVGDRGCKLSGGERQRVAIARAVLKNSPILILDEATASLDSESEAYIAKSITEMLHNKTVLAIAHRLSTLKNMDRIVVLDKGVIVESGSFDELIKKKNGKLAHLWQLQQMKQKNKRVRHEKI